ncbi:N-(5'-phosphoribosyl)anthranilate isomerase [bioreactor metagenome]|uniref:phosphoribosylanthranilate isomerase n=1 Tax=bioreactor metagenome TaxID=1076179 RepID=A0A645E097_9ZZZZ|nr:phosphoribosylanthranilate isomerase [Paludibacter sp.]
MNRLIKICGLKSPENIRQVVALQPDMIGFIFYPKSPRYLNNPKDIAKLYIPPSVKRIGVFVNEAKDIILEKVKIYQLQGVQLHGDESPALCLALKQKNLRVIKAFSVSHPEDLKKCALYEGFADYFLFDTKTQGYGGSGEKFDWEIINAYKGLTPFILSGGISPEDTDAILSFKHARFAGIDLNSRFEVSPGEKNIESLKQFLQKIKG